MKALQAWIDRQNKWNAMFGNHTPYEVATAAGRQRVAQAIDCALSPENLSCDGELPRSLVQSRYNELTKAARELQKLDPSVKFYEFA